MKTEEVDEALVPESGPQNGSSYRKRRRRDLLLSVLLFGIALYATTCLFYWGWRASHPVSSEETKAYYRVYYLWALGVTPLAYLCSVLALLWRPIRRRLKRAQPNQQ